MWRRLAVWVAPSVLGILVIGCGSLVADIHRHQVAQQAYQDRMAQHQERSGERAEVRIELTMLAFQSERDQLRRQLDAINARADDLQGQVDKLTNQIAALEAVSYGLGSGPVAPSAVSASNWLGANHFAYGWCTWYVASRRYVPWNGNAGTWLWEARAFGYPTGQSPRPGAIMVTAESIWGHVAYVESVASNGTFTVSEMNYSAWGMVDWRTILPSRVAVLGFIY